MSSMTVAAGKSEARDSPTQLRARSRFELEIAGKSSSEGRGVAGVGRTLTLWADLRASLLWSNGTRILHGNTLELHHGV